MNSRFYLCCAGLLLLGAGCLTWTPATPLEQIAPTNTSTGVVQNELRASSSAYTVLSAGEHRVALTLTRPSTEDANVLLAVPGTYSSPQNTVEGYVILDGTIVQEKERQGWNGAALFSRDGTVRIEATNRGRLLTKEYLADVAASGGSLVQGHLLVTGGVAEHFIEQPLYVRRALTTFADGRVAVIESHGALNLNDFANDLVALGVEAAMNLDMGSWGAGWYRDEATGGVVDIGVTTENTRRQTNWLIFRVEASD